MPLGLANEQWKTIALLSGKKPTVWVLTLMYHERGPQISNSVHASQDLAITDLVTNKQESWQDTDRFNTEQELEDALAEIRSSLASTGSWEDGDCWWFLDECNINIEEE